MPPTPLPPFENELDEIGAEPVDIAVSHCGICHSDLSMLDNDWQVTRYPFVPGHENVGRIEAVGAGVSIIAAAGLALVIWGKAVAPHIAV